MLTRIAQLAEEFMNDSEFHVDSEKVFSLVSSSQCSSYDCEFVALAQSLNFLYTLRTEDQLKNFPIRKIIKKYISKLWA